MRKFYFSTMLIISLIIAGCIIGISYIILEKHTVKAPEDMTVDTAKSQNGQNTTATENSTQIPDSTNSTVNSDADTSTNHSPVNPDSSINKNNTAANTTTEQSSSEQNTSVTETAKNGPEYFDDALFIGDSRTVGLSDYGELGNAEVFANNGMSVYKIWTQSVTLKSGKNCKLEPLLKENTYTKIYIMLGINELGYDFDATIKEYAKFVNDVQALQPSAIIYVEGNLHVTKNKGASSKYFNNERINLFNQAISQLADNHRIYYLDINEYFDDKDGNLAEEYTGDGMHVYGKYYSEWIEWILSKAI